MKHRRGDIVVDIMPPFQGFRVGLRGFYNNVSPSGLGVLRAFGECNPEGMELL